MSKDGDEEMESRSETVTPNLGRDITWSRCVCVCGSVHTYIPCFVAKTDEGQHFLHTSDVSLC